MILYLTEDVINEAVSGSEVVDAINNRKAVLINYADKNASHTGKRYIEPYVYGVTKAGNPCIRAYQYWGDTKRGVPKWKLFRLDRVQSWEPTEDTFELEPKARGWAAQAYNNNGDGSMAEVYQTVELGAEPQTDYERLKARTRQIKNSKPININNVDLKHKGKFFNEAYLDDDDWYGSEYMWFDMKQTEKFLNSIDLKEQESLLSKYFKEVIEYCTDC